MCNQTRERIENKMSEEKVEVKKNLVMKLAEVMQEVKYIQKRGFNSFHKYKYATESDVAEKVREELASRHIMMIPNVVSQSTREHTNAKGKTEYIATITMEFRFIDGESGEEISFHSVGEGQDSGDKAVYKGITGAQKYALMKVFMIPTGDDPEADSGTDERNADNKSQQKPNVNKSLANDNVLNQIESLLEDVAKAMNITKDAAYKTLKARMKKDMEWYTPQDASKAIKILQDAVKKGA